MINEQLDKKKELILKTTRELLAKNGFAKTTLEDIANVLGMKKSSLYYYYTNKDALIKDVMQNEEHRFFSMVTLVLEKEGTTMEKIINYEKAKFEYVQSTVKLHDMSTSVLLEMKSMIIEYIKNIQKREIELLQKILLTGIEKNEIKKCDTKKVSSLILTFSEALRHREFYLASFTFNKDIDFSYAVDEMVYAIKLIFDGLSKKNKNEEHLEEL